MKLDRQLEVEHLAQADRHVAEGQVRVDQQQARLAALGESGFDTALAERLLETLERTLIEWRAHREEILRRLANIDASNWLPGS
ncbi:hypothetical protein JNW90_26490 [Micromonospora sp. STR1s_5]|nr:hypothetical protein [Micromonospora sp. STR1s_5]